MYRSCYLFSFPLLPPHIHRRQKVENNFSREMIINFPVQDEMFVHEIFLLQVLDNEKHLNRCWNALHNSSLTSDLHRHTCFSRHPKCRLGCFFGIILLQSRTFFPSYLQTRWLFLFSCFGGRKVHLYHYPVHCLKIRIFVFFCLRYKLLWTNSWGNTFANTTSTRVQRQTNWMSEARL